MARTLELARGGDRYATSVLILDMRDDGYGWQKIADSLERLHVPTVSGRGRWHAHSVRTFLDPTGWGRRMAANRTMWRSR